jgi:hypothetical protein
VFCEREDCWDWNPVTDSWLAQNYSEADFPTGKAANKRVIQREYGLKLNPEAPLGIIALDASDQRAVDLLDKTREKLSLAPAQWIIYEINGRNCHHWSTPGAQAVLNEWRLSPGWSKTPSAEPTPPETFTCCWLNWITRNATLNPLCFTRFAGDRGIAAWTRHS